MDIIVLVDYSGIVISTVFGGLVFGMRKSNFCSLFPIGH